MKKPLKKPLIYIAALFIAAPVCLLTFVYFSVTEETAERIKKGEINSVIASESPVYYDDEETPIGVFFDKTHRRYIPYPAIPRTFIHALISTEDRSFFSHPGFDLKAILRSLIANIKAGRVVQGGSTITQQTAKNVFKRQKRTYWAKLKELMQAVLLERKYTKEEILEMYSNQFFVTGYGKGLGIAAQYFFGKEPGELDLVESAFIAGALKAPNRYNPFVKKNEAEKLEARRLAKMRKNVVLSNMRKMNFIAEKEFLEATKAEIPFKEGTITYRLNVILDYIREQLSSDFFQKILLDEGVENIATSGISIYTSVNKEVQSAALESLRTHLPLMDTMLRGYAAEGESSMESGNRTSGGRKPREGTLPFLCRITGRKMGSEPALTVSWDNGAGIVNYGGLKPLAGAWMKWKKGRWAGFNKKDAPAFLRNFHRGDLVAVRALPDEEGEDRLVLTRIPKLQGGLVVLNRGMIKAMAGGFFNRFFNRAVDARRQLGSIFKPIVYTAALQLKWNILDRLSNRRDVFSFENILYMPRPDHTPESEEVSMVWAGVKSENLATVWLLYHLTDRLNLKEFERVAATVGLSQERGESYTDYKKRIRDRHGVIVNRRALMEAAFEEAKAEIKSDIIFQGRVHELEALDRLHYSIDPYALGYEGPARERIKRLSYERLTEMNLNMKARLRDINRLRRLDNRSSTPPREMEDRLRKALRYFYRIHGENQNEDLVYFEASPDPSDKDLVRLTPQWLDSRKEPLSTSGVRIDNLLCSSTLDLLQRSTGENYGLLSSSRRYDIHTLSKVRDFRTLVNLFYVVRLSKAMGISSRLDPVLSFPLGPSSISILEAASAYQTMMTGHVYGNSPEDMSGINVPIITKIVDRKGTIIWEYEPEPRRILSERISGQINEVLKKVVQSGTGRRAKDSVRVLGVPIPSFGKTGTSNRFTNSSFVGFIPGPGGKTGPLDLDNGYVISGYIGYDDNEPMKSRHISIYGSSGALPLWIDTANAIVNTEDYMNHLQLADIAFEPLGRTLLPGYEKMAAVPVSPLTGLPVETPCRTRESCPHEYVMGHVTADKYGTVYLKRGFEPLEGFLE